MLWQFLWVLTPIHLIHLKESTIYTTIQGKVFFPFNTGKTIPCLSLEYKVVGQSRGEGGADSFYGSGPNLGLGSELEPLLCCHHLSTTASASHACPLPNILPTTPTAAYPQFWCWLGPHSGLRYRAHGGSRSCPASQPSVVVVVASLALLQLQNCHCHYCGCLARHCLEPLYALCSRPQWVYSQSCMGLCKIAF